MMKGKLYTISITIRREKIMEREKWYPKECYNQREDITRMNKAKYDREEDQAYRTIQQIEDDLRRGLTIPERLMIMNIYHEKV